MGKGWEAGRRNLRAGVVLWLVGIAVVGGYYWIDAVRSGLLALAEWKTSLGLLFPAVSTALFGGVVPLVFRRFLHDERDVFRREGVFSVLLWAGKGIEVDCFYRLQAHLFGDGQEVRTIAMKTAFDQLVYVPFWALPSMLLLIFWHQSGYSAAAVREDLAKQWVRRRMLPVLGANWGVWIPAVAIIYCLPTPLQLPLQNLVLCLWVLMLAVLTRKE